MTYRVSCTVTYRRTWTVIEAESAEQARKLVFSDGCDMEHDEELIEGPCGPSDLTAEEEN